MNKTKGEIPITTNRTLEEIENAIEIEKEKSAKLTDWENVDTIYDEQLNNKTDKGDKNESDFSE